MLFCIWPVASIACWRNNFSQLWMAFDAISNANRWHTLFDFLFFYEHFLLLIAVSWSHVFLTLCIAFLYISLRIFPFPILIFSLFFESQTAGFVFIAHHNIYGQSCKTKTFLLIYNSSGSINQLLYVTGSNFFELI